MLTLASLRSDIWTASPELVDDFIGIRNQVGKGILTLSVDDLKDISNAPSKIVVVVGGGIEKKDAIRVALRTKMVNSIITDEDVARYLLKKVTE